MLDLLFYLCLALSFLCLSFSVAFLFYAIYLIRSPFINNMSFKEYITYKIIKIFER